MLKPTKNAHIGCLLALPKQSSSGPGRLSIRYTNGLRYHYTVVA